MLFLVFKLGNDRYALDARMSANDRPSAAKGAGSRRNCGGSRREETEEQRSARARVPSWDDIVLGIKRLITGEAYTEWNVVMATAILAMLPPALVVMLMQKWFVKGLVDTEK